MNIKEAKFQIKNAMTAYFAKDKFGNYEIPIERQRPIFLMGPPGIGKTAIMEQVAAELGVGLVSYSMTHHTRQSAIGLPFIVKKNYDGKEYDVSEYTMSEIIVSVYDMMEETGVKEGILFLDEINCVSETLAPAMLQFLQFKIFGRHRVPDGWIVVTAGNPPEYNNSVRDFDIVTWDRLKRIDIEPDFNVWKEYGYLKNVHPAVMSYLEIRPLDFYSVATTVDGKTFVTARGWDDLSTMIHISEKHNLTVDENLIGQYLQNKKIAKEFAVYYDLFKKYRSDYQVDKILEGKANEEIKNRARSAEFDERLSLLGLILSAVGTEVQKVSAQDEANQKLLYALQRVRGEMLKPNADAKSIMASQIALLEKELASGKKSGSISKEAGLAIHSVMDILTEQMRLIAGENDAKKAFEIIRTDFTKRIDDSKKLPTEVGKNLENVFEFCEAVFSDGQEILILVTELTANYHTSKFIAKYGCPAYFRHNKELLFYERNKEIIMELEALDLE